MCAPIPCIELKRHFAHPPEDSNSTINESRAWSARESLDVPALLTYDRHGILDQEQIDEGVRRMPGIVVRELEAGRKPRRDQPAEPAEFIW